MVVRSIDSVNEIKERMNDDDLQGFWSVPDKVYHSPCLPIIGHSGLLRYENSPADYRATLHSSFKDTDDIVLGRAVHKLILEGRDAYEADFVQVPEEINRRTKVGRQEYTEFLAANKDCTIISQELAIKANQIAAIIRGKPIFKHFLKGGLSELSCFAKIPETEVWVKCRPDYWLPEVKVIVDLKTTRCANKDQFNRDIFNYGYEVQGAFYMDVVHWATGIKPAGFYCFGIQKFAPYKTYPMRLKDIEVELGTTIYRSYLDQHVQCVEKDLYPANDEDIEQANAPEWKLRKWGLI